MPQGNGAPGGEDDSSDLEAAHQNHANPEAPGQARKKEEREPRLRGVNTGLHFAFCGGRVTVGELCALSSKHTPLGRK